MEYFWKENKRYCIAVGGAFLFLILFYSFVIWPIRAGSSEAANKRIRERKELERRMSQGMPTADGLALGRRDLAQTGKVLAEMAPQVAFTLPDRFQKPKREDIKSYYDNLKINLYNELKQKAIGQKVMFPQNLGLPDDVSDETAIEVLSRLAMVDRVVNLAIESEMERIDVIDGQYGMDQGNGPQAKKSTFLTKYSIFVKVTGRAESVFRMVHGAQKKGSYLAVTHLDMGRSDATKDLFEVSMAVSLLRVDDKSGLEAR